MSDNGQYVKFTLPLHRVADLDSDRYVLSAIQCIPNPNVAESVFCAVTDSRGLVICQQAGHVDAPCLVPAVLSANKSTDIDATVKFDGIKWVRIATTKKGKSENSENSPVGLFPKVQGVMPDGTAEYLVFHIDPVVLFSVFEAMGKSVADGDHTVLTMAIPISPQKTVDDPIVLMNYDVGTLGQSHKSFGLLMPFGNVSSEDALVLLEEYKARRAEYINAVEKAKKCEPSR